jgi:hypothetical protein
MKCLNYVCICKKNEMHFDNLLLRQKQLFTAIGYYIILAQLNTNNIQVGCTSNKFTHKRQC